MQTAPEIFVFIGRFHPLFVHLPIGLVSFALLLELLMLWKPREAFKKVLPLVWLLSAVSAVFSASSGYLLSLGGGYEEETLNQHKISGIVLAATSTFCYLLYILPLSFMQRAVQPMRYLFVLGAGVLLVITGHGGGSLTHGSTYLTEFSPLSNTPSAKNESIGQSNARITSLDSADIFEHAVMPILQSKCVSCHNKEKQKGELLLTSYEEIMAGGKTREGVIPGNLSTSEIFRRITLPKDHKEFMPTDGKKPLTENQVAILEWWIETGAHKNMMIASMKPNKKMQDVFGDFFQIGRDAILSYTAEAADQDDLAALINEGFQVYAINQSANLLEIKYNGNATEKPNLQLLTAVKDQLVWLQLTNCNIEDEDLKTIGQLSNLYKLNLNRTKVTDKGINELAGLSKLEYLNLYGTAITDSSVIALQRFQSLKKLYVWETAVDTTRIDSMPKARKDLDIVYKLL
ncbi:MAG: c-type cytochrome domain-containing protein [bacterium]